MQSDFLPPSKILVFLPFLIERKFDLICVFNWTTCDLRAILTILVIFRIEVWILFYACWMTFIWFLISYQSTSIVQEEDLLFKVNFILTSSLLLNWTFFWFYRSITCYTFGWILVFIQWWLFLFLRLLQLFCLRWYLWI